MRVTVYACDNCGALMVADSLRTKSRRLRRTYRAHRARGLCTACYQAARINGTRVDHERLNRAADELLDDWVLLRDDGYSLRDAAARIGVTFDALDQALCRAKRRGDPRGSRKPFAHDMRRAAPVPP